MADWATFHGSAEDLGDQFKLTAAGENGILTLPKDSVEFINSKICIKVGAIATILKEAEGVPRAASYAPLDGCKQTHCVGLVEICCDDGRVLGPCQAPVKR
jgi:hypothetical protein